MKGQLYLNVNKVSRLFLASMQKFHEFFRRFGKKRFFAKSITKTCWDTQVNWFFVLLPLFRSVHERSPANVMLLDAKCWGNVQDIISIAQKQTWLSCWAGFDPRFAADLIFPKQWLFAKFPPIGGQVSEVMKTELLKLVS